MRTFLKYAFVFCSMGILLSVSSCENTEKQTADDSLKAKVQRGDYLVNAVANCMHCHADRDFTKFGGPPVPGTEGKGGQKKGVPVLNITPTVLGSWTDADIKRAITSGITNVGDTLFFTMPYMNYQYLTDDDAESIVAYLRTLKALIDTVPKRNLDRWQPGILTAVYHEFYVNDAYKILGDPAPGTDAEKGKYLVTIGGCLGCHTPLDAVKPAFKKDSLFAGGQLSNKPGNNFKVNSANITPDTATGIGSWTEEVFLAKFQHYRSKEAFDYQPGKYNSEMPWTIFANMKDDDIRNIYRYLRTIKPIRNKVTKWPD